EGAVRSAGIGATIDAVLSVESVGVFKPSPRVYRLVTERFACTPAEVLFVSSNGWDAAAAAAHGFRVAWVNRAGLPVDRLPGRPHHQPPARGGIPDIARPGAWVPSPPRTARAWPTATRGPARRCSAWRASPGRRPTSTLPRRI